jgi:nijmegen breakage syndrome protein 1
MSGVLTLSRFSWVPVTFTFSFTAKEARADPYTPLYDLLGPLDIKVLVDYVRGQTTHVVAKKRNTSKGLQALLDGKYIVHNDSYINAILAATTVMATTEENDTSKALAQSLLELDWDENFPDPLKYLPPRGDEPTQRDSSAYSPNNIRQDLFDGYIFIFYEKRQFETLLAPITDGRGKALLRDVVPGRTEINDFVGYVKSVAGEKGLGKFEDGSEGKGVVVVRFNPVKCAGSEWFSEFNRKVSLYLDHRLIEQNEFLDAILGNDASMLRKSLELEASGVVAPPSTVGMFLDF